MDNDPVQVLELKTFRAVYEPTRAGLHEAKCGRQWDCGVFHAIHTNGNILCLPCGLAGTFFLRCVFGLSCGPVHFGKAADVVDRMPFPIFSADDPAILGVAVL